MKNNSTHPPKSTVNGKLSNSCTGTVSKPSPNQGMKLFHSDKAIVENPTSGNPVVEDSSNKKTETCGNTTSPTHTHSADEGMKKGTARSNLYEICAAKHWKPPIFECCKEEGPSHKRMFTFKVIIEIEEGPGNVMIIECYGSPHPKKKAAADHAAEGALWYLKAYMMCNEKPITK